MMNENKEGLLNDEESKCFQNSLDYARNLPALKLENKIPLHKSKNDSPLNDCKEIYLTDILESEKAPKQNVKDQVKEVVEQSPNQINQYNLYKKSLKIIMNDSEKDLTQIIDPNALYFFPNVGVLQSIELKGSLATLGVGIVNEGTQVIKYIDEEEKQYVMKRSYLKVNYTQSKLIKAKEEQLIESNYLEYKKLDRFHQYYPYSCNIIGFQIILYIASNYLITELLMENGGLPIISTSFSKSVDGIFEEFSTSIKAFKDLEEYLLEENGILKAEELMKYITDHPFIKFLKQIIDFNIGKNLSITFNVGKITEIQLYSDFLWSPEILKEAKTKGNVNPWLAQIYSLGMHSLMRLEDFFNNPENQKFRMNDSWKSDETKYSNFMNRLKDFASKEANEFKSYIYKIIIICLDFEPRKRLNAGELYQLIENTRDSQNNIDNEYQRLIMERKSTLIELPNIDRTKVGETLTHELSNQNTLHNGLNERINTTFALAYNKGREFKTFKEEFENEYDENPKLKDQEDQQVKINGETKRMAEEPKSQIQNNGKEYEELNQTYLQAIANEKKLEEENIEIQKQKLDLNKQEETGFTEFKLQKYEDIIENFQDESINPTSSIPEECLQPTEKLDKKVFRLKGSIESTWAETGLGDSMKEQENLVEEKMNFEKANIPNPNSNPEETLKSSFLLPEPIIQTKLKGYSMSNPVNPLEQKKVSSLKTLNANMMSEISNAPSSSQRKVQNSIVGQLIRNNTQATDEEAAKIKDEKNRLIIIEGFKQIWAESFIIRAIATGKLNLYEPYKVNKAIKAHKKFLKKYYEENPKIDIRMLQQNAVDSEQTINDESIETQSQITQETNYETNQEQNPPLLISSSQIPNTNVTNLEMYNPVDSNSIILEANEEAASNHNNQEMHSEEYPKHLIGKEAKK